MSKARGKGKQKAPAIFKNVLALPNIHVRQHFSSIATDWATLINICVLAGEQKHKWFKANVLKTNQKGVEL